MKVTTSWIGTLVLLATTAGATDAAAQTPALPAARVTVSIDGSYWGGGVAPDLEHSLRRAGMGETDESAAWVFFGEPVHYPRTQKRLAVGSDVRLRAARRVSVGLTVRRSGQGSTEGNRGDFNPIRYTGRYSLTSFGPVMTLHAGDRLRLGAGPAFHRAKFSAGDVSSEHTRYGFVAQAGVALWSSRRLFSEVSSNYVGAGSLDVPATSIVNTDPFWGTTRADIPAMDVSFSHWTIGVSLGFRM